MICEDPPRIQTIIAAVNAIALILILSWILNPASTKGDIITLILSALVIGFAAYLDIIVFFALRSEKT